MLKKTYDTPWKPLLFPIQVYYVFYRNALVMKIMSARFSFCMQYECSPSCWIFNDGCVCANNVPAQIFIVRQFHGRSKKV